jgi:hypothetical protein
MDIINIGTISLTAVLGGLIYILIEHFLAKDHSKQERFLEACKKFNGAFIDDIRRLEAGNEDAYDVLKSSIVKHETAMIEFKKILKGEKLQDFGQAWNEYYYGNISGSGLPFIEQYFAGGSVTKKRELTQLALQRLEKLISFAKIQ